MNENQQFAIIGVHRGLREVVGWTGKNGFVPLTTDRLPHATATPKLKLVTGGVAEELMKHITKRSTTTKYEFVLVPVVGPTTGPGTGKSESGLILPHLH